MNYKIIEKQAFRIVGVCKSLDVNFEESYKKGSCSLAGGCQKEPDPTACTAYG